MGSGRRSLGYAAADMVARLRGDVAAFPDGTLPSLRRLAAHYGVARETVTAAIRALEAEGKVARSGRGRYRTPAAVPPPLPAAGRALRAPERVRDFIRDRVRAGAYPAGEALPKSQFFTLELGIAPKTLLAAFRALAGEGVVHKRGRQWVAGRRVQVQAGASRRAVFLLMPNDHSWSSLDQAPRTRGFCVHFDLEARKAGVRIVPFPVEPFAEPWGGRPRGHRECRQAFEREWREWGSGALGILVIGGHGQLRGLGDWLEWLPGLGKPVAWFDRNDEGLAPLDPRLRARIAGRAGFTRCHFHEAAGLEIAMATLAAAGHRRAAFAPEGREGWIVSRFRTLVDLGRRRRPPMEVGTCAGLPLFGDAGDPAELADHLASLLAGGTPWSAARLRALLAKVPGAGRQARLALARDLFRHPSARRYADAGEALELDYGCLHERLLRPGPTALIAANDRRAVHHFRWLRKAGLEIPGDLSLISFDNSTADNPLRPITTVDFGFDFLGYAAFHALAGDIPLPRNRKGDIAARPRLVDKGSVGPTRRGGPRFPPPSRLPAPGRAGPRP